MHQQEQQQQLQQQSQQGTFLITLPQPNRPQQPLPAYLSSSSIQRIIAVSENTPIPEEFPDAISMVLILEDGEKRLIIFTLTSGPATIHECLTQLNVPFRHDTNIQVTEVNTNGIDYVVTVGNVSNWCYQYEEESDPPEPLLQPVQPLLSPPPHTSEDFSRCTRNYKGIKQILTYPPEGRGRITINIEDYKCLAQGNFLNDGIIEFYLKYLVDNLNEWDQTKVHVFSTFFYKRLTTKFPTQEESKEAHPTELKSTLTAAQERHARVKTWTRNVNIFEKDYIVVPIHENNHWFLAIICFPALSGPQTFDGKPYQVEPKTRAAKKTVKKEKPIVCEILRDVSEFDSNGSEDVTPPVKQVFPLMSQQSAAAATRRNAVEPRPPIKQPCILIFDSMEFVAGTHVVAKLRDYLTCEHKFKTGKEKVYTEDVIKEACPKVPQQTNFSDCGLYLLQYVEQFFKDPIKDFYIPILSIKHWFDEVTVMKKREDLAKLIITLMKANGKDIKMLPDIGFPTLSDNF